MTLPTTALPRTYLYVPGNARDKLSKVLDRGADAVILDLEDAVPLAEKDTALAIVLEWIESITATDTEIWVRLNAGSRRLCEARALAAATGLTGLVLAKSDDVQDVRAVAEVAGGLALMPMVETARAVLDARDLASVRGVRQLQIGEVDLAGEVRIDVSSDESELAPARAMVVLGSAAAGIAAPPGPVSREVRDLDAFTASTLRLQRQGFDGRVCIHPGQVAVVHDLLSPTDDQVDLARKTLALLTEAESTGAGVVLDGAGRLVDAAVIRSAWRVVELAQRSRERSRAAFTQLGRDRAHEVTEPSRSSGQTTGPMMRADS